jgi:hypothetical protein
MDRHRFHRFKQALQPQIPSTSQGQLFGCAFRDETASLRDDSLRGWLRWNLDGYGGRAYPANGRGLIYLVRSPLSILFDGLLGTKQWRSAYLCLNQSISAGRDGAGQEHL